MPEGTPAFANEPLLDVTAPIIQAQLFGTMAHSWIQSFPDERSAFEAFVDEYGDDSVLLVDTCESVRGARVAGEVAADREVDQFISSGMDEYGIDEFLKRGGVGARFGPGTALVTSTDAPKVEGDYKLVAVELDGGMRPTMKLSPGKVTYPGAKTVRRTESGGEYAGDVVGRRGEDLPGEELLVPIFEDGERVTDLPELETLRERRAERVARLPVEHRRIEDPEPYDVRISEELRDETDRLRERLEARTAD